MAKKNGAADKQKEKDAAKEQRKQLGDEQYQLGPQEDGAIVIRIEHDFDLMIVRKALERQIKNAGAAVGTVSALADGEDPFIDAVQRSVERTLKIVNKSRAPANQLKDTPIGRAIAEGESRVKGAPAADAGTHHGGTRAWAAAIPMPRPSSSDIVEFPDKTIADIVDAIGFKGDGLTGSESDVELQALADEGKLAGAFEVVVQGRDTNVLVVFHDEANGKTRIWRVQGGEYAAPAAEAPAEGKGNLAPAVAASVAKATGRKKVPIARSGRIKTGKKKK